MNHGSRPSPAHGLLHHYEVRAYDKAGNTSTGTADSGITTVDLTAPPVPEPVVSADG
ncbi:hypothetical protein [Streptomyces sp. CO7]